MERVRGCRGQDILVSGGRFAHCRFQTCQEHPALPKGTVMLHLRQKGLPVTSLRLDTLYTAIHSVASPPGASEPL